MSKRLEDFIKTNKEDFDDLEVKGGLWGNIEERLPAQFEIPKQTKTFSLGFVLRVAATVIVIMSISFVLYLRNEKTSNGVNLTAINPEYAKQRVHYVNLISSKRTELRKLSVSNPELYSEFSAEIAQMDSTYKRLNKDLATSPNPELILRAMVQNLRVQAEALNQQLMVIEQYNQMTKEQKNESKSI